MIVAYVSCHGFGHSTRVGEVLKAVRERDPRVPLAVVSAAPRELYEESGAAPFEFRALECDVGLAQKDALVIDEATTAARCRLFAEGFDERASAEAEWLRRSGARVVLGDIPALAFEAAARAGVPGLGLANFSWDWIYRHMAARQPSLLEAARAAAAAYAKADLLLELPFAGDLSAFPRRERIPLVARRPRLNGQVVRERLGLDSRPLVLLSFGGLGLPGFDPRRLAALDEFRFVTTGEWGSLPGNAIGLDRSRIRTLGLGYEDLVGASDVVVTKPGYGIVSDAIGGGTRIVFTERGDFPEYPILVREMAAYVPSVYVSNDDLLGGRLGSALRKALEAPMPEPPELGGAAVAAEQLLGRAV
jgi:L-arabinokinase